MGMVKTMLIKLTIAIATILTTTKKSIKTKIFINLEVKPLNLTLNNREDKISSRTINKLNICTKITITITKLFQINQIIITMIKIKNLLPNRHPTMTKKMEFPMFQLLFQTKTMVIVYSMKKPLCFLKDPYHIKWDKILTMISL